jgi:hypothetical protein
LIDSAWHESSLAVSASLLLLLLLLLIRMVFSYITDSAGAMTM